jgi:hypothetical protein
MSDFQNLLTDKDKETIHEIRRLGKEITAKKDGYFALGRKLSRYFELINQLGGSDERNDKRNP